MPLSWRKSKRLGRRGRLHLSRSGASYSRRAGPITFNTRRGWTVRLPFGLVWRRR